MSSFSSEESFQKQSNSKVDSDDKNNNVKEDDKNNNVKEETNKSNTKNKRKYSIGNFPAGYRFCPYDYELIVDYLKNKVTDQPLPHDNIKDVDLYKFNPFDLAAEYPPLGDREWYFFSPRDRKYANGERPSRRAGGGYWKATGSEKSIKYGDVTVGFERALVFYTGKPPQGDKTTWIMHEYRMNQPPRPKSNPKDMRLDDWVLCKIYEQSRAMKKHRKQGPNVEMKINEIVGEYDNVGEMNGDTSGGNESSDSQSHRLQHLYAHPPDQMIGILDHDLQYHVPIRSIAPYNLGYIDDFNDEPYHLHLDFSASPPDSIDSILDEPSYSTPPT